MYLCLTVILSEAISCGFVPPGQIQLTFVLSGTVLELRAGLKGVWRSVIQAHCVKAV